MVSEQLRHWGSYPLIFGGATAAMFMATAQPLPYWPTIPLIALAGVVCVASLERRQPYETRWLDDHQDTLTDAFHAAVSLTLLFTAIEIVAWLKAWLPAFSLWPAHLPLWLQVLLAGAVIDFGLWSMHWASHKHPFLWRLHAIHHSAERLYWLNGERRHPLSALLLAGPGILVTVLLGAPSLAIGIWFSMMAVHLAFQHSNLNYSIGPFRYLLGVAENHRWHHKREYEDAQVNFGEFWMLWDHLFGTYHYDTLGVHAGDVGMRETMPITYVEQLKWPFHRA